MPAIPQSPFTVKQHMQQCQDRATPNHFSITIFIFAKFSYFWYETISETINYFAITVFYLISMSFKFSPMTNCFLYSLKTTVVSFYCNGLHVARFEYLLISTAFSFYNDFPLLTKTFRFCT